MHKIWFVVPVALAAAAQSAAARDDAAPPPSPEVVRKLMDCRAMSDSATRLACYDQQTAALDQATRNREIVISDKQAVQAARRGLFGFAAPIGRLMGFGGDDDKAEEISEIETTLTGVRRSASGWKLDLADGSTWEQNDTRDFVLSPKPGQAVRISKGVIGTYFVSVNGQRAIKMRRVS